VNLVLRERAAASGTSLNEAALRALERGLGLDSEPARRHDLDDLAGKWVKDPAVERALDSMDIVDPELWR